MTLRKGRGWLSAAVVLGAVFASGSLTGVAVDRWMQSGQAESAELRDAGDDRRPGGERRRPRDREDRDRGSRDGRDDRRESSENRFLGFLTERLELTEDQRTVILEVLQRSNEESGALFDEIEPRLRERLAQTRSEIREHLSPEQTAEFDRLVPEGRMFGRPGGDRGRGDDRRRDRGRDSPGGPH